jgi:DNA-binding NarL/FixJ family response regulator
MRVLLATDQPTLGEALAFFLTERRIDVIGVVSDADVILSRATASRPDVVLVDWHLGPVMSTQAVRDLQGADDPTPVIILTTSVERPSAQTAGATGYATLGDPPDTLLAALTAVVAAD